MLQDATHSLRYLNEVFSRLRWGSSDYHGLISQHEHLVQVPSPELALPLLSGLSSLFTVDCLLCKSTTLYKAGFALSCCSAVLHSLLL